LPKRRSSTQLVQTEDAESSLGMAGTVIGQRLWQQATLGGRTPDAEAAAAERLGVQLRAGLSRWIGKLGYDTLLDRSLRLVQVVHPAIQSVSSFAGTAGPPVAAKPPTGPAALDSAVVTLLATMSELLGRMVGPQMADDLLTLSCAGQGDAERPLPGGTDG